MKIAVDHLLESVKSAAHKAGVFGPIEITDGMLRCAAATSAAPAWYRLEPEAGQWFVSLVTPDRWLSESIEADLMHHGDPIEELIEEELNELLPDAPRLEVKHYRSDDLLYTFRTRLPIEGKDDRRAAEIAAACLLAYEAAFRRLGDMDVNQGES